MRKASHNPDTGAKTRTFRFDVNTNIFDLHTYFKIEKSCWRYKKDSQKKLVHAAFSFIILMVMDGKRLKVYRLRYLLFKVFNIYGCLFMQSITFV